MGSGKNETRLGTAHLLLSLAALSLLVVGLVSPIATVDRIFLEPSSNSLVGGIWQLLIEGSFGIGGLILFFSVLFPIGKIGALLLTCWQDSRGRTPSLPLGLLEFLGKWSMLDVFVIAVTFGAANLGILSDVQVRWGIYVYALAVLLSMIATFMVSWSLNRGLTPIAGLRPSLLGRLLTPLALLCFLAGVSLPLAAIEKWLFWQNEYSLLRALPSLMAEGEWLMPLLLAAFVLLLPLLRFLLLLWLRWRSDPAQSMLQLARFLDKWAMFDVYVLALLIVLIKLQDSASVQMQVGFWLLLVASVISWADSLDFRRSLHSEA